MKYLKPIFISSKLLIVSVLFTLALIATQFDILTFTKAWLSSRITAMANLIETGYWTPATPINEGWNLPTLSASPNEQPLDLLCGAVTNGGNPSAPRVAHNWSLISGANIVYQREVTYPSGAVNSSFYETQNYTNFVSFGSGAGINGLWRTRVRAFEDVNNDGVYTEGVDVVSDWSNYCDITLDTLGPSVAFSNIPLVNPVDASSGSFEIRGYIEDPHLLNYRVQVFQSDASAVTGGSLVADSGVKNTSNTALERTLYSWNVSLVHGYYLVVLSATDSLGNASQTQALVQVNNPTPPSPTITISNSPEKQVIDRIKNGSFEDGLSDWQATGLVSLVDSEVFDGSSAVMLGGVATDLTSNQLTQSIDNVGKGLRSIGFWYKLETTETALGFDEPAFMVYINGQMRYMASASSATSNQGLVVDGWRYASVYLADITDQSIELTFYAGNTADQQQASTVYLDKITSNATVVNKDALFTIYADNHSGSDAQVLYEYWVGKQLITQVGESGMQFTLVAQPNNQELYYWTRSLAGMDSVKNRIEVLLDTLVPSTVTDLKVYNEGDGEYSLTFTAPKDDVFMAVREYDIRYSEEPITQQTDWSSLPIATLLFDDQLPGNKRAPKSAGLIEDLIAVGLETDKTYYFAIKSVDIAGNVSAMSNVASPLDHQFGDSYTTSPVVINEIAYNPVGNDNGNWHEGEWVELYNKADRAIDLAGWFIVDDSGKKVVISKDNSDNNLVLIDGGETVIAGKGWLTVYRNGARFLNNDGDSVSLYNQAGSLVDSYVYQGNVPEGMTEARVTDGSENWSFKSLATPGRYNAVSVADLVAQAIIYQHSENSLNLVIFDANNYSLAEYRLIYAHTVENLEVAEVVEGKMSIDNQQMLKNLPLATCSAGGACVDHEGLVLDSVRVDIILKGDNLPDRTLSIGLTK